MNLWTLRSKRQSMIVLSKLNSNSIANWFTVKRAILSFSSLLATISKTMLTKIAFCNDKNLWAKCRAAKSQPHILTCSANGRSITWKRRVFRLAVVSDKTCVFWIRWRSVSIGRESSRWTLRCWILTRSMTSCTRVDRWSVWAEVLPNHRSIWEHSRKFWKRLGQIIRDIERQCKEKLKLKNKLCLNDYKGKICKPNLQWTLFKWIDYRRRMPDFGEKKH